MTMKGKGVFNKDLQPKSVKELVKLRAMLRKKEFELRGKNVMKALTKTNELTHARKSIARVETVLASKIKEINGGNMK